MSIRASTLTGLLAACLVTLSSTASWAQEATPRVDNRQDRQAARIEQGAASGALTGREQRRLNREQRAIDRKEQKVEADGKVTPKEARRLEHMQDRASRDIRRQKHDRQTAPTPGAAASGPKG
jgi:hypothetical protein